MSPIVEIDIHSYHRQDLINKTKEFIAFWRDLTSENVPSMSPGNVIRKEDNENFNLFVKSLYKKCKDKHLLASTIELECIIYLDNLINSGKDTDDQIGKELDSLIKKLEDKVRKWIVIFPIDHLNLSNLDSVELRSGKLVRFNVIEREFGNIINEERLGTMFKKKIKEKFTDRVCLMLEVIAEEQNQYEKAWTEYENIINIFMIYLSYYRNIDLVKIGLDEDVFSQYILLSFDKEEVDRWGISGTNRRFKNVEFTLTPEIVKELEERHYFDEIKKILGEKDRSKLQTQILLATRWIGAGIHEDIESDKILKFATALECLLIPGKNQDNKSKSEALAERCAFLLQDVPSERYKIYNDIKDLYDVRSGIVHEGDQITDSIFVFKLMDLAIRCLFKVIEISAADTNMHEIKHVIDWVDNKKMKNYYGVNKAELVQEKTI